MNDQLLLRIQNRILDVPDFPRAGVLFKDITPLLADAVLLPEVIAAMARPFSEAQISHVMGVESRGFLFGVPIALALGVAFVPARKRGKLPRRTVQESYGLEYGDDVLSVHEDAFSRGARLLIVDDVLATGGTAAACCRIVDRMCGEVVGLAVLAEILALAGRDKLPSRRVDSLIRY